MGLGIAVRPVFAAFISSLKITDNVVRTAHKICILPHESMAEAQLILLKEALDSWPLSLGWKKHSCEMENLDIEDFSRKKVKRLAIVGVQGVRHFRYRGVFQRQCLASVFKVASEDLSDANKSIVSALERAFPRGQGWAFDAQSEWITLNDYINLLVSGELKDYR